MSENLFIRIDDAIVGDPLPVDWMLLDEVSGVARERGRIPLEELSARLDGLQWSGRTIVLVPGEQVLHTSASVPSRKQRQIMQALPYMIEEQLAVDVESSHFAMGQRLSRGDLAVAVVASDQMQEWMALLEDAGISPSAMVADSLCVPWHDESATILIDGEKALVRIAAHSGITIERELLGVLLQLQENGGEAEGEREDSLTLMVDREEEEDIALEITQWEAELNGKLVKELTDYPPFETLCRNFTSEVTNLLQGEFKPADTRSESRVGWASVVTVALVCFVLHMMLLSGQGIYLSMEASRLEQEAADLYKEVFPNDRNVRDIRRRWASHLTGSGTTAVEGDFLALMGHAGKSLKGGQVVLDNVNYNEQRGDIILQVRAPSSDQLVAYSQRLTQLGLTAEIGAINQGDDAVNGSVKIRQDGGS